ncbi:hypothetical protein PCCS19_32100 [Paenibacillus sp. CCS19]|uniref:hypothetical protein n=1 Tax=Paenibacillus sp. CCS19 TaxID=3158387 RepID=UPI00255EFC28|nr:hypothetical protein [Paenibacillus cellulosilyticus]GMK40155.1 hypothetical protein PCCS19_32100 [Paenibacillus cellulosilyticus]
MTTYWKLLSFELRRLLLPFCILVVFTTVMQLYNAYSKAHKAVDYANKIMKKEHLSTMEQYAAAHGYFSYSDVFNQMNWIVFSIFICAAFVGFYFVIIWYRDTIGRHPFMTRLLMLPASRNNLYWAKLTAPLLIMFSLLALQQLLVPIGDSIYSSIVPSEAREDVPLEMLIGINPVLNILLSNSHLDFLLYYGTGITMVIVVFTVILLERSYRLYGLLAGIAYAAVSILLIIIPLILLQSDLRYSMSEVQVTSMYFGLLFVVSGVSVWFGQHLLAKKISI